MCEWSDRRMARLSQSNENVIKLMHMVVSSVYIEIRTAFRNVLVTMTVTVAVTVGVVEVGVVDTRYGVSQPGADAER